MAKNQFLKSSYLNICDINSQQKLNNFVCDFMTDIIQLCDKNIPKAKHNTCFKGNNWWTPELCQQRSCVNNARRRYQRCLTDERQQHFEDYLQKNAIYNQLIDKTRKM